MAKLRDVSFIFLNKTEHLFAGTLPTWEVLFLSHLIPSGAAGAPGARLSVSVPCLSSALSPSSRSCPPPASSVRRGGERAPPGSARGGLLIQACCRRPAPRVCTRYLINPGIPRGLEMPAGREWALSPHLILTSAVITLPGWQAEAESLSSATSS